MRPVPAGCKRSSTKYRWVDWDIHLETVGEADASVRILLIHGAGGNAAALWPFAAHLSKLGALVTVPDLPGYGLTRPASRPDLSYPDWQNMLVDLVDELHDSRPLIVLGASMGGMLALDTASQTDRIAHVVVTCLLDLTDPSVRAQVLRPPWNGRAAKLLALVHGPLRAIPLPLRWVTPMRQISNDADLSTAALEDRRGGGSRMPLGWYVGVTGAGPKVAAEDYRGAPVLLLHPGEDRWTPIEVSRDYLQRLPVPTRFVELPGAGHFPVEEPGFQVLLDEVEVVVRTLQTSR